jgi:acetyl-CoA carboxylase biotin carboxyl carrier protein
MQQAELTELELDDSTKGVRVHLRRGPDGSEDAAMRPVVHFLPGAGGPAAAAPLPVPGAPAAAPAETPVDGEKVTSPMVGTFYRAPSPDADVFVEVGARVEEDTVLCIIEAMKVMNEIKAEMRGTVVEILVENGDPVEFGQPLFVIKKG